MVSDIVGLNTTGEIAVWKSLQKQLPVTPFKGSFSLVQFLQRLNIIDKTMAAILQKERMHVDGEVLSIKQIARRKFQQFELDLTDERIPVLTENRKGRKAA